jgi:preprotein translocase SecE subunit
VKKAAWPTWPELKKFTAVVILAVLIVGIWIGGWDFALGWLSKRAGIGH